jgi:hypothetical protein
MRVETDDLLTLTNAAKRSGNCSRQNIASLVARKKIPAVIIDSIPFVRKQDIAAYKPDRGGRPKKAKNKKPKAKELVASRSEKRREGQSRLSRRPSLTK